MNHRIGVLAAALMMSVATSAVAETKAPAAGGKAASFALINGAADKGAHIAAASPTKNTYLIAFISLP